MWNFSRTMGAVVLAAAVCGSGGAAADPGQLVPADAVAAITWQGMDDADPAYAGSRLKAVLEATDLGGRINAAVIASFSPDPGWDDERSFVNDFAPVVWRKPWAIYFQGLDWDGQDEWSGPKPKAGFVIEPGEDKAVVEKWLTKLIDAIQLDEPDLDVVLFDDGNSMGLLINSDPARPGAGLGATPRFTSSFADLSVDPHATVYIDMAGARALFDVIVQREQPEGAAVGTSAWAALLGLGPQAEVFGTDKLDRLAWAGGFNGRDWEQATFVAAPAPRAGLLALLDQRGLRPDELRGVPKTATWMRASRFDVGEAWDVVMDAITQLEPRAAEGEAEFRAEFAEEFGFDIRDGLVDAMGDTWTFYADPSFGGMFGSGIALVQEPRDPQKLEQTLGQLTAYINAQMEREGTPLKFLEQERGGVTLHTMMLPFVSPTWAVVDDGRLIIGLSPQTITSAQLHAQQPENSLINGPADSPDAVVNVFKRIDPPINESNGPTSTHYADYEKSAPQLHQAYSTLLNLLAMQAGDDLPFHPGELLPPLADITPHLAPGGSVGWVDDAGYHQRSITPFPGASLFSQDVVFGGGSLPVFGLSGVMFPMVAMGRTGGRSEARAVASMSNMRQLSIGLFVYSADHEDRFPDRLEDVFANGYIPDTEVFFAPDDPNQVHVGGPVNEHTLRLLREHGSYIFVTPGVHLNDLKNHNETIALVEHPRVWRPDGRHNVGYADGHVSTSYDPSETRRLIEQQTGRTLEQWIERSVNPDPQPAAAEE